jgi:hypothetical protein
MIAMEYFTIKNKVNIYLNMYYQGQSLKDCYPDKHFYDSFVILAILIRQIFMMRMQNNAQ